MIHHSTAAIIFVVDKHSLALYVNVVNVLKKFLLATSLRRPQVFEASE